MRIAVTGSTGYVGQFLTRALLDAGHEVRAMVRPGASPAPAHCEPVTLELDPETCFRPLLRGADALIHAAFAHVPGRYRRGEGDDLRGFLRTNLHGSTVLMTAAHRQGVGRAVILSSRAVYGRQPPGAVLLEDGMSLRPDTHYGAIKLALEGFASSLALQEGWPVACLRPTGVYGLVEPVERSKWFDLVADALAGRPLPSRGGTEVHGSDVASACLRLLEAPADLVAGVACNCSDLYVTTRDLARIIAHASGRTIALPCEPADAKAFNAMDCTGLSALGWTPSGRPRLEQTIKALVLASPLSRP